MLPDRDQNTKQFRYAAMHQGRSQAKCMISLSISRDLFKQAGQMPQQRSDRAEVSPESGLPRLVFLTS